MRTICAAFLALGLCVSVLGCKKRTDPTNADGKDTGGTPGPAAGITLPTVDRGRPPGKTNLTGRIEADGHTNFVANLNEQLSKGVTAENNSNVALWRAFGPSAIGEKPSPGYFEKLGIPAPPATGGYYVGLKQYAERTTGAGTGEAAFNTMAAFTKRPWTAADNPTLNGWLQANEKPLAVIREGVKLPHYYNPMIPEQGEKGSKGLLTTRLPGVQACREVAAAFACRAMLFLGQNKLEEAWQDLLACHRLGRLVGRGGCLIEGLVGAAIEAIACQGEIAYLDRATLDAKAVERCLRDLSGLPPMAPIADKIDLGERSMFLDIVTLTSKQGLGFLQNFAGEGKIHDGLADLILDGVDWIPAIENANKWFDRLVDCARESTRAGRVRKLTEFRTDVLALKAKATDFDRVAKMFREKNYSGKAKGEAIGDILISLMLPAADKVIDAGDRTQQTFDTVIVGYACAWYQRFNNKYPAKLADLAPTYLQQVPKDMFTGNDLIYKPDANGFLLYSVGVNGRDDGGRSYTDQPAGDDIVVRISHR
jgi:hypothetical protein